MRTQGATETRTMVKWGLERTGEVVRLLWMVSIFVWNNENVALFNCEGHGDVVSKKFVNCGEEDGLVGGVYEA